MPGWPNVIGQSAATRYKHQRGGMTPLRSSIPHHHQPIRSGFPAPRLARPSQHLAHVRALLVAWERRVGFSLGIEALDGVGGPIGGPDAILVVDVDRIGPPLALR